jgi:hypothetical protein
MASSKKDFIRAARIAHAIDRDVRGRVVDAFCDFFREEDSRFDVTRFVLACEEGVLVSAASIRKNRNAL